MREFPKNTARLPDWLKTNLPREQKFFQLRDLVHRLSLNTVCESASCPNIGRCWEAGTLTLMILGNRCSRACRFCDVPTGNLLPPDDDEPRSVAEILSKLSFRYAVITSVDRDDLPDGGAEHWARTIHFIKQKCLNLKIEALIPDFQGNRESIGRVCQARPHVLAHNMETVESLQKKVRPQCGYQWSLDTLALAEKKYGLITKSGLMLGHGETKDEVVRTMKDLIGVGCQILSIGQYLRPSNNHLKVEEYIRPEVFAEYKEIGESLGFDHVESGPLVRSSYFAEKQFENIKTV